MPYSLDEVGCKAENAAAGVDQQALTAAMRTVNEAIPDDNTDLRTALAESAVPRAYSAERRKDRRAAADLPWSLTDMLVRQNDTPAHRRQCRPHRLHAGGPAAELGQIVTNLTALLHQLAFGLQRAKGQISPTSSRNPGAVTATLKANVDRIDQT